MIFSWRFGRRISEQVAGGADVLAFQIIPELCAAANYRNSIKNTPHYAPGIVFTSGGSTIET